MKQVSTIKSFFDDFNFRILECKEDSDCNQLYPSCKKGTCQSTIYVFIPLSNKTIQCMKITIKEYYLLIYLLIEKLSIYFLTGSTTETSTTQTTSDNDACT